MIESVWAIGFGLLTVAALHEASEGRIADARFLTAGATAICVIGIILEILL